MEAGMQHKETIKNKNLKLKNHRKLNQIFQF
jgi:hypothetical protein